MKLALTLSVIFLVGSVASATFFEGKSFDDVSYRSHVELGAVHWQRDFEKAKQLSKTSGRPLFVLFQEIPGCATCQNFGKEPLSHPLVVEAIEDLFVPVTIFNNKSGIDAQLLKKFGEPSWNNPVVRFMTAGEDDIISRRDGVWNTDGIVERMMQTLKQAGKPIPDYLKQISLPKSSGVETAEFAMHCYWEGEIRLGSIPGVYTTRSGWRDGREVVQVKFAPSVVNYTKLLETAMQMDCASKVFAHSDAQLKIATAKVGSKATTASGSMRDAKPSDQKYYLTKTPLRHLPLTEIQATKINAIGRSRKSPLPLLSPRQREMFKRVASLNSSNPAALRNLQFPENQADLGSYQSKLQQALSRSNP